jgi:hypothetical protein
MPTVNPLGATSRLMARYLAQRVTTLTTTLPHTGPSVKWGFCPQSWIIKETNGFIQKSVTVRPDKKDQIFTYKQIKAYIHTGTNQEVAKRDKSDSKSE